MIVVQSDDQVEVRDACELNKPDVMSPELEPCRYFACQGQSRLHRCNIAVLHDHAREWVTQASKPRNIVTLREEYSRAHTWQHVTEGRTG